VARGFITHSVVGRIRIATPLLWVTIFWLFFGVFDNLPRQCQSARWSLTKPKPRTVRRRAAGKPLHPKNATDNIHRNGTRELLTGMTVEGETNYFGHQNATDDYIAGDMQSDSRRYEWVHSNFYPNTFKNIDGHGRLPDGTPVFFASMNFYTEARERNGTMHKATRRLIVAYAVNASGHTAIYSISQIDPDSLRPHR
jgi:hypothetical protein